MAQNPRSQRSAAITMGTAQCVYSHWRHDWHHGAKPATTILTMKLLPVLQTRNTLPLSVTIARITITHFSLLHFIQGRVPSKLTRIITQNLLEHRQILGYFVRTHFFIQLSSHRLMIISPLRLFILNNLFKKMLA